MGNNLKIIFNILILTLIGILTRTIFHIAPNVEFITAIGLFAGYSLKSKSKIIPTLLVLIITDFFIKNSIIFVFTWSAFLMTPFLSKYLNLDKSHLTIKFLKLESMAIFSTMVFFLWTNFGVVVTTNMYEKNIYGLIESYVNALPFLQNQIVGNLIITPLLFIAMFLVNLQLDKVTKKSYHLFNFI